MTLTTLLTRLHTLRLARRAKRRHDDAILARGTAPRTESFHDAAARTLAAVLNPEPEHPCR